MRRAGGSRLAIARPATQERERGAGAPGYLGEVSLSSHTRP